MTAHDSATAMSPANAPTPPGHAPGAGEALRGWGNHLCIWRLCDRRACRRARACRGNSQICFPRYCPLLPSGVQAYFAMLQMSRNDNQTFDEAMRQIRHTWIEQAFCDWHAAVEASLHAPAGPMTDL